MTLRSIEDAISWMSCVSTIVSSAIGDPTVACSSCSVKHKLSLLRPLLLGANPMCQVRGGVLFTLRSYNEAAVVFRKNGFVSSC